MGIETSQRVSPHCAFPADDHAPNAETRRALRDVEAGRGMADHPAKDLDLEFGKTLLAEGKNIIYGDGENTVLERPDGSKKILTPGDYEQDLS